MAFTNKANREVCDVDIRTLKTMAPYLYYDLANTTGIEISSEDTYAMGKGQRRVAFSNPMENTFTISAQVVPQKFYALLSDGTISSEATYAEKSTIKCETAGTLTLPEGVKTGTVFAYPTGSFGDEDAVIEGTFEGTTFTATDSSAIEAGTSYDVGYIMTKTSGVHTVKWNDKKNPEDYFVTMLTNDKDEDGNLTAKKIVIYKAKPQKSVSLSYSSEDDPITIEITFTALTDKNGNNIDLIEFDDEAESETDTATDTTTDTTDTTGGDSTGGGSDSTGGDSGSGDSEGGSEGGSDSDDSQG